MKVVEERRQQALCEDVRELARARYMKNMELAECNLLSDEMNVELDVFGPPMMNWIACHVHRRNVVAVRDRGALDVAVQLAEKLS